MRLFLVLVIFWQCTSAQVSEKFFRNDYTYFDSTKSFYKINTIKKNWHEAKKICVAEGTSLFYPENANEAEVVMNFLNRSQNFGWVFVGGSALLAKGVYETTDGTPVNKVYHNWAQGEPNGGNKEDCIAIRVHDGVLDDLECSNEMAFICKKTLDSLHWNEPCNMPNTDYVFNNVTGGCYKFHLDPKSWTDAYAACSAEQSYVAVIDSQAEADYLVDLIKNAPKDKVAGDYLRGAVLVGFHNKTNEGWVTVKGVPLIDSGYSQWGNGEPNNANDSGETCGSLFYGGGLNDISCDIRCFFICEHDVEQTRKEDDDSDNSVFEIDARNNM